MGSDGDVSVVARVLETPSEGAALVGRQPIVDRHMRVLGYEMLFRSPGATSALIDDGDRCTAEVVVNTFVDIGLDAVVGETQAFLNATRRFIVDGFALQLPPDRVVIEVLEDVTADAEVIAAIQTLKTQGFQIALDDFRPGGPTAPLLALADIVKLDLRDWDTNLTEQVQALSERGTTVVVERVETAAQFEACVAAGATGFQGYYVAHPAMVSAPRQKSLRVTTLRLLALLSDDSITTSQLDEAISCDVSLSYKLLKVINSAGFALATRVTSLHQAIMYLGRDRIRQWVRLVALAGFEQRESVIANTLTRAHMCQSLGVTLEPHRGQTFFTVGLFSTLDTLLGMTMGEAVAALPLSEDINDALVGHRGILGEVLAATEAYERCAWEELSCHGLAPADFRRAWLEAIQWARQTERELGRATKTQFRGQVKRRGTRGTVRPMLRRPA